jgi:hypothetical protein
MEGLNERLINKNDNFSIFTNPGYTFSPIYYAVNNGRLLSKSIDVGWSNQDGDIASYDSETDHVRYISLGLNNNFIKYNLDFLIKYDILLFYKNNKVFFISSFSNKISSFFNFYYDGNIDLSTQNQDNIREHGNLSWAEIEDIGYYDIFHSKEIITNVSLDSNLIVKYELSGNIYYDLIPQFVDLDWIISPFVSGTYIAPATTVVSLQSINK